MFDLNNYTNEPYTLKNQRGYSFVVIIYIIRTPGQPFYCDVSSLRGGVCGPDQNLAIILRNVGSSYSCPASLGHEVIFKRITRKMQPHKSMGIKKPAN